MHKFVKTLGASFACMFIFVAVSVAFAADLSRGVATAYNGRTTNRAASVARMPSIPVLPTNADGNVTAGKDEPNITPEPKPEPKPDPKPDPECPDGGVRNSEYTVANCMDDVLSCINNGALAGGLNDLFNEDVRNAIVNGMWLCSVHVEKCMETVRRDCKPVYRSIADVWVDFNSRKVQPAYYNFVLRKTGLTPHQAENTCWLLDKNTYGPSFAAVANSGKTTSEYDQKVGAYNGQLGNVLIKNNPMGAKVNDGNPGVDGARGHYARWDATTATCYLRVGAYNKDKQIKNSWLFGAAGNDQLAEVWRAAGDTFKCSKDLFGFSLMNNTNTTAVVGIGGGTLLGAGVGAIAGHGKRAFDCGNAKHREMFMEQIRSNKDRDKIVAEINKRFADNGVMFVNDKEVDLGMCQAITNFYDTREGSVIIEKHGNVNFPECDKNIPLDDCFQEVAPECVGKGFTDLTQCLEFLKKEQSPSWIKLLNNTNLQVKSIMFGSLDDKTSLAYLIQNGEKSTMAKNIGIGAAIGAGTGGVATAITAFVEKNNVNCRVGDGLNTVAYGKSHSIDTLKDFYVKWNLRVPDTVSPTSTAVDCKSWKLACAQYTDLEQCKEVALNYKPNLDGTITLIHSACAVSGSVCIENAVVAASYGACALEESND